MHLTSGEIRAYQDQELDGPEMKQAKAHLDSCQQCQEQAEALRLRAQKVSARLASLNPPPLQTQRSSDQARAGLEARRKHYQKEHANMWNQLFSRLSRPVWAGLAVIALLAVSLAFPPVRAIANSFLGLFRVQQFSVVQVNPGNLPEQLGSSSQLEYMLSTDVEFTQGGPSVEVASAAEAGAQAGLPVRLPAQIRGEQTLRVQPGGQATFTVDIQHVRALLDEIGRSDIQLPAMLNGAKVEIGIPTSVMAQYGDCRLDLEQAREQGYDPDNPQLPRMPRCTSLVQMPSPTISAPPGLDVSRIGEAFLQIMGMSREEAEHFAKNIDWTTTFVIPIPRYGTSYEDVMVDGVTGTLIRQQLEDHADQYMLLWVKDGIVYALAGPGDNTTALTIANSLE